RTGRNSTFKETGAQAPTQEKRLFDEPPDTSDIISISGTARKSTPPQEKIFLPFCALFQLQCASVHFWRKAVCGRMMFFI
ncbi:MAG: hypothetical protein PUK74_01555, partial [Elusimicrobia bacterium]|nr:hypothetical protein [Elusimicrobiota bacterium]MDY5729531.1 hypothetical protein [Elusimicrobiaceae bacterium]